MGGRFRVISSTPRADNPWFGLQYLAHCGRFISFWGTPDIVQDMSSGQSAQWKPSFLWTLASPPIPPSSPGGLGLWPRKARKMIKKVLCLKARNKV